MDWVPFHHPTDNFSPFVRWLEIFFGYAEGSLYNQRTLFRGLSEKSFAGGGTPSTLSLQKVLSLFNGQNESECHDFVSLAFPSRFTTDIFLGFVHSLRSFSKKLCYPLYFTTDIFPQKLDTLFQKNFFCP